MGLIDPVNNTREWYDARMIEDGTPQNCLPDSIPVPNTFADYKALSALLYRGWNHANQVGYWVRYSGTGEEPTYGEIRGMLEHAVGMHAVFGTVARHVLGAPGKLFEIVTTLTPSSHKQTARLVETQCKAVLRQSLGFIQAAEGAVFASPDAPLNPEFSRWWQILRDHTWYDDTYDRWDELNTETARIEEYFRKRDTPTEPVPEWSSYRFPGDWQNAMDESTSGWDRLKKNNPDQWEQETNSNGTTTLRIRWRFKFLLERYPKAAK